MIAAVRPSASATGVPLRGSPDVCAADATLVVALRKRFAAAYAPRPLIYYADLLASATLGWGAFSLAYWNRSSPWLAAPLTLVASLALLRAVYFVHEVAHLGPGKVPYFELVWHVVAGVPNLIPALMVGAHKYHHKTGTYGTAHDPEYAPIARWGFGKRVLNLASLLLVPPLLWLRWGVIAPLSWLLPPLRRVTVERLSTLQVPEDYRREAPVGRELPRWRFGEAACAAWVWAIALLAATGRIPFTLVVHHAVMLALALVINQIRTFVAHAYANDGSRLSTEAQFDDTLTLGGGWLTEIVAPLGDRFHALHHALPSVPYHALGAIHRRLLAERPPAPRYEQTFRHGVIGALRGR